MGDSPVFRGGSNVSAISWVMPWREAGMQAEEALAETCGMMCAPDHFAMAEPDTETLTCDSPASAVTGAAAATAPMVALESLAS